jgi:hypothetical protein
MIGVTKAPSTFIFGTVEIQEVEKERLKKNPEFELGNNVGYSEPLSSVFDDLSFFIVDEANTTTKIVH